MAHTRQAIAVCALSGVIVAGCGAEPHTAGAPRLVESVLPAERDSVTLSGEQPAVATALTAALGDDPRFGSIGVDAEGNGLILYWFGEPPVEELESIRAQYPTLPIDVRATDVRPGDLRLAARRLLQEEGAVNAVELRPDGSGIVVRVDDERMMETWAQMADRLSEQVGYPVDVQGGGAIRFF